jgi:hypothetical protein
MITSKEESQVNNPTHKMVRRLNTTNLVIKLKIKTQLQNL